MPLFEMLLDVLAALPFAIQVVITLVGFSWVLNILDVPLNGRIRQRFSFKPTSRFPFFSFYTSTMVHKDWKHLRSNTWPFIILASGVILSGLFTFFVVSNVIIWVAGFGLWFFSKNPVLGASGLIAGYFGYLLTQMFISPDPNDLFLGVMVLILAVVTLGLRLLIRNFVAFRAKDDVSRLGHSVGLVGGVVAAFVMQLIEQMITI